MPGGGAITEGVVEEACLEYLEALGYERLLGAVIAPAGEAPERTSWDQVVLFGRLRQAVERINPDLPDNAVHDVVNRVLRWTSQSPMVENQRLHQLLTGGVQISTRQFDGSIRAQQAWVVDWENPDANDWLVVNQFSVVEDSRQRRPDVVVFVNGLPLAVVELKNPGDEHATTRGAWNQLQTYRRDIPSLFTMNAVCVVSDAITAKLGAFSTPWDHFGDWKTIDGKEVVTAKPALETLITGVFDKARFLDLVRNFVVFTDEPSGLVKRVAKYHQYWAVNTAVESTIGASGPGGDRRGGVVWHTQGSGKSIEMLFYVAKLMRSKEMGNPTVVLITDRNDLDDQLFEEVFAPARILPERPQRAQTRDELRRMLRRPSGGIIFTTLQKFAPTKEERHAGLAHPLLTDRRNVVVVADEAHRSQYDFLDGYARHLRDALPNATYLGFTGTPIELTDRSTRQVFGEYIDIYDLTRAVEDGATVRIYYESRLAKVYLSDEGRQLVDEGVDEFTEDIDPEEVDQRMSRWARVDAIVGTADRLDMVAEDVMAHWRARSAHLLGKAMLVCASRRICVEMYDRIVELRPGWHDPGPMRGKVKVIMSGSADDPLVYQPHLHSKGTQRAIKARAKDPDDPLELLIVQNMWLTGFDAPPLHTMYLDRPMQGANLMQAIARVNRTFRDKPGGLIVDYLGLAPKLQEALADYSQSDRQQAGIPIEEAVDVMLEKHDVVTSMLHDISWTSDPGLPAADRVAQMHTVMDWVLADPVRKARYLDQVLALMKAFALCGARDEALAIRDDVKLLRDVRTAIVKLDSDTGGASGGTGGRVEMETAIAQLISEAITADEVVDIYRMAGIERPELSLLSDEFLNRFQTADHPNLQLELLKRLLNDEIRSERRTNVVQARRFSELLDEAINRYTNRTLSTAEIIATLVDLAKEMRDQRHRATELGLTDKELAFYDAVCQNDAAILEMGDDTLKAIARELVNAVRSSATIDWHLKESAQAGLRAKVKRLLARYRYPPDRESDAIALVMSQAEQLAENEVAKS